eukprot:2812370-Pleurochrysis_carterae.AAC.1
MHARAHARTHARARERAVRTSVPSCDGSSPRSNRIAAAGVLTELMIHPYWNEGSTESAVPHSSVAEMDVSRYTLSSSSTGASTCPPTGDVAQCLRKEEQAGG